MKPGEAPSYPFDESWLYLIKPEGLREKYLAPSMEEEVPPKNMTIDNLEEATMMETNLPLPQPRVEYIEIEDEGDSIDPNEESRNETEVAEDAADLSSLHTKVLFKKAQGILAII